MKTATSMPKRNRAGIGQVPPAQTPLFSWAITLPAVLVYAVGLPLFGAHLDHTHGITASLPSWLRLIGAVPMALGLWLAVRSAHHLVAEGRGSPNPARPPSRLVTGGPYLRSRNPLMIGAWVFGAGLALSLSSISLLALYTVVALIGVVYVRRIEEPRLERRFGDIYRQYASRVPRWLVVITAFGLTATGVSAQMSAPTATPAVVVRIDVTPGGTRRWIGLFEEYMAPAIREAIASGNEIIDFEYFEGLVASESTDIILVLRAESFGFFDERRPFPHYMALFRRLGREEGARVLDEMTALERSVEVTLVRSYRDTEGGTI